jgi:hypothetical protein
LRSPFSPEGPLSWHSLFLGWPTGAPSSVAGSIPNPTSDTKLSRTSAGYVNYNDVDSDWHWPLSAQDYNDTDYNNWEQISAGSFLNPLGPCRPILLRAAIGLPCRSPFNLRSPAFWTAVSELVLLICLFSSWSDLLTG